MPGHTRSGIVGNGKFYGHRSGRRLVAALAALGASAAAAAVEAGTIPNNLYLDYDSNVGVVSAGTGGSSSALATGSTSPSVVSPAVPEGITIGPSGTLYYSDFGAGVQGIYTLSPNGGTPTLFSTLGSQSSSDPVQIAFSPTNGNLYVAGYSTGNIYQVNPTTGASTIFANVAGASIYGLAFDSSGDLYADSISGTDNGDILKFAAVAGTPSTTPTVFASPGGDPNDLAVDSSGNVYVTLNGGSLTTGSVVKFGSLGGSGTTLLTGLNNNTSVSIDANGNLWAGDDLIPSGADYIIEEVSNPYANSGASGNYISVGGNILRGFTFSAVPEPASLGLLAIGAIGALTRRRRTSRSS